jgi:hypothetical protein
LDKLLPIFSGNAVNNPFLQQAEPGTYSATGSRIEGEQQQYYGGGYSQAQSGYSSSGFGKILAEVFGIK